MTYSKLVTLKYKLGFSTHDLLKRFPGSLHQISEVALMDVPNDVLREVIKEEEALLRLMQLKKRFLKFLPETA